MSIPLTLSILAGLVTVTYIVPHSTEFTYVQSSVDKQYYKVRNLPTRFEAANQLARIRQKIQKFIVYLKEKYPKEKWVTRLQRANLNAIQESSSHSRHSAFSVNKGESLHFCIRNKKTDDSSLSSDMNTLVYVALHELAHVMTESIGHTEEFWKNHAILVREAIDAGIYLYVDYKQKPSNYCGEVINHQVVKQAKQI